MNNLPFEIGSSKKGTADKKTIVFILPSFDGGGAERVVLNLMRLVDRQAFRPIMIVLNPVGQLADEMPADIPVIALNQPKLRNALPKLILKLRSIRPAVIFSTFTHVNIPILASKSMFSGSKIVIREANLPSISLNAMPWPAAFRQGCRWFYPKADAVLASSKRMYEELNQMGVPPEILHVFHNPVDHHRVRQSVISIRRHEGEGVRFVAAGRLVRQKGFDFLLDAMSKMPSDCHCTILGEGREQAALLAQAKQLNLGTKVRFAGFQKNPANWIAGADAFLMPSRYEGMPNAALESLALGTPVISTPEAGGISEISAVVIAALGEPYLAAMRAVKPANITSLRVSSLPQKFHLEKVKNHFSDVLLAVMGTT